MLNGKSERRTLVNKRATEAAKRNMKTPGNVSGGAKSKGEHGQLAKDAILTEWLHVFKRSEQHGLQQVAGLVACRLEECSRDGLKFREFIEESNSKMCLLHGMDKRNATIDGKKRTAQSKWCPAVCCGQQLAEP